MGGGGELVHMVLQRLRRRRSGAKIHGGCTGEDTGRTDVEWREATTPINGEWERQQNHKKREIQTRKNRVRQLYLVSDGA